MAITFISPQKRRKKFIVMISLAIVLGAIILPAAVFFQDIMNFLIGSPPKEDFQVPEVKVNFRVVNSEKLTNLKLFEELKAEFAYTAKMREDELISSTILASSKNSAIEELEKMGLEVIEIQQTKVGRVEPFLPF